MKNETNSKTWPDPTKHLIIYAIYENPSDFPGKFVVRRFVDNTPEKEEWNISDSLDEARKSLPTKGLRNVGRYVDDDPVIKEVWL